MTLADSCTLSMPRQRKTSCESESRLRIGQRGETKLDVLRTLDGLASKLKTKGLPNSPKGVSLSPSVSPSQLPPVPATSVQQLPPDIASSSGEPTTPEDQIFGIPDIPICSASSSTYAVPGLTPDTGSSQKILKPRNGSAGMNNSVRRKPLPKTFEQDNSPLAPLKLSKGFKPSDYGSDIMRTPSSAHSFRTYELCGFCDMPLGTTFRSETSVRMLCGHAAHRDCHENILGICHEYGDEAPTCTICDGPIAASSSDISVSKAAESFEPRGSANSVAGSATSALRSFAGNDEESFRLNSPSVKPAAAIATPSTSISLTGSTTSHRDQKILGSHAALSSVLTSNTQSSGNASGSTSSSAATTATTATVSPINRSYPNVKKVTSRKSLNEAVNLDRVVSSASDNSDRSSRSSLSAQLAASMIPSSPLEAISSPSPNRGWIPDYPVAPLRVPQLESALDDIHVSRVRPQSSQEALYRSSIETLFASNEHEVIESDDHSYSLDIVSYVSPPQKLNNNFDTRFSEVALWIRANGIEEVERAANSAGSFRLHNHRTTATDVQLAIAMRKHVETLKYRGKKLKSCQLGMLRLSSVVGVTSPERDQLHWPNMVAYLFENSLILVTSIGNRVKAVLNPNTAIQSVGLDIMDPRVVQLKSSCPQISSLDFHTESAAAAYIWSQALTDPSAQFPLDPTRHYNFLDEVSAKLDLEESNIHSNPLDRTPAEIVLCMPFCAVANKLSVRQDIKQALNNLGSHDKMSLILYSAFGIHKVVKLHRSFWPGWTATLEELSAAGTSLTEESAADGSRRSQNFASMKRRPSICKGNCILDLVLETAVEVLEDHNLHEAAATVIVVSDDDSKLDNIPSNFEHAGVPINTVGVTESHNALALSTMSSATGGSFTYTQHYEDLGSVLEELVHMSTQYVTREVVVRLRPRIGAELSNFRQQYLESKGNPKKTELDSRVTEWKLGRMRAGEVKCLIFDVQGSLVESQPIVQVMFESFGALGQSPSLSSFRYSLPSSAAFSSNADDDTAAIKKEDTNESKQCMLNIETILGLSYEVCENVLAAFMMEQNRRAFQSLSAGLGMICEHKKLSEDHGSRSISRIAQNHGKILEILEMLFDQQCDNIIEHKLVTRNFVLESLQTLWLLSTKRVLTRRDPLRAIFD